MENLILLLTASLVLYKSSRKFKKVAIGDTGCSVFFSADPVFDHMVTEEGDALCFAEHHEKDVTYGVLCARLSAAIPLEEAQDVLTNYLSRLHRPFNALYNTGVDTGDSGHEQIVMTDYWQDEEQKDWKVKGCTDGGVIAVLYIRNINAIGVEKQEQFLDSFCFGRKV